jgi:hypothetical protein
MRIVLAGFVDELVKSSSARRNPLREMVADKEDSTAEEIVRSSISSPKSYAKTMALGAISAPLLGIASKRLGHMIHNMEIRRALSKLKAFSSAARSLKKELKTTKLWGLPGRPDGAEYLVTPGSLATDVTSGALAGSVVQAVRDKIMSDKRR